MITRDELETMIRDISDRRGYFSRESRNYRIKEENMMFLCDDLAEKINARVVAKV